MFLNFVRIAQFSGGDLMFYDVYLALCKKIDKKPSTVAFELGINKSNVSNWKNNGYTPRGEALNKIADYFGVTTDYLLGAEAEKAPTPEGERPITFDDFTYAFYNESKDLPDEKKKMLLDMARFMKADLDKEKGE